VIGAMPTIEEVAVIGVRDERFGETVMAIARGEASLSPADIVAWCNDRLADYKVPRYVVLESLPLPRLATGKLNKRELKQKWADAAGQLEKVR